MQAAITQATPGAPLALLDPPSPCPARQEIAGGNRHHTQVRDRRQNERACPRKEVIALWPYSLHEYFYNLFTVITLFSASK